MNEASWKQHYLLWVAKLCTVLVVLVFLPVLFLTALGAVASLSGGEGPKSGRPTVALLELTGVIEDTDELVEQLYKQAFNKDVKGIVLRIDSPGGAAGPSQAVYNAVRDLKQRKPIVAVMGSVAASGGLYAALSATKILVQPSTQTGSIGVLMQFPNISDLVAKTGVEMVTLTSGKLKDVGNIFREVSPTERQYLQDTLMTIHEAFVGAVVEGRGLPPDKVKEFADGRLILGSEAIQLGLADGIGDVFVGARTALELAEVPLEDDVLPDLYRPVDKFERFLQSLEVLWELPVKLLSSSSGGRFSIRLQRMW